MSVLFITGFVYVLMGGIVARSLKLSYFFHACTMLQLQSGGCEMIQLYNERKRAQHLLPPHCRARINFVLNSELRDERS